MDLSTSRNKLEKINTNRARSVESDIEQATGKKRQQGTATPQEAAQRAAEGRTQGRKGCKAERINIAFTTENYEYIREMSQLMGISMTKLVNLAITRYREEHEEGYRELQKIRDKYNLY